MTAVALAFICSMILILFAARISPDWKDLDKALLFNRLRSRGALEATEEPGDPVAWTMWPVAFGVMGGLAAALGFVPGNILFLPAALMACTVSSVFRNGVWSDKKGVGRLDSPFAWLVVLAWLILAGAGLRGSFDLSQDLAAQSVLGPILLTASAFRAVSLAVIFLAALAAAAFWVSRLGPLASIPAVDAALHWGASALAGAAVAAPLWGPSAGALVKAPVDGGLAGAVALSFGVTAASVLLVSFLRPLVPRKGLLPLAASAGLAIWSLGLAALLAN